MTMRTCIKCKKPIDIGDYCSKKHEKSDKKKHNFKPEPFEGAT